MQLYQRLLAASFERLPPALRRFHAQPGGTATFVLEVTHEPGLLHRAAAALMRLPAASLRAPGTLVVTVCGEREVWERTFADTKLTTVQHIDGGRLVEAAGPLSFVFEVTADERGMQYAPVACRCLGIPLPRAFAPRISAAVRGEGTGWDLRVSIAVPGLGRLAAYGGPVTPGP